MIRNLKPFKIKLPLVLILQTSLIATSTSLANATENSQAQSNISASSTTTARTQLHDILASEQFSEKITTESWQEKPKPPVVVVNDNTIKKNKSWLEKLFNSLFNFDGSNGAGVIAPILKLIFIVALIAFIIWVVISASKKNGWSRSSVFKRHRTADVSDYESEHMTQHWQSLPPHEQVPSTVQRLIESQQYNQAASILYRSSLRWLSKSHALHIAPATTEMQCIDQMTKISEHNRSKPNDTKALSMLTVDYITHIIRVWIELAYNLSANTDSLATINTAKILQELGNDWLKHLPSNTISSKNLQTSGHTINIKEGESA